VLLRLVFVLLITASLAANVHLLRRVNRGDREYLRRFLGQPGIRLLYRGGGLRTVVRTIVPVSLLATWLGVHAAVVILLQEKLPLVVTLVFTLGIVVLGINVLVVRLTGWPRFQVPAPFRGMSEAELQGWFSGPLPWDSIVDHLPLDVVDASAHGSTLLVRGHDWYLAIWAPWRGEIGGRPVGPDDAARDSMQQLGGQQLVAARALVPQEGVVVFEFTDGRVEVRPVPSEAPWRLRLPERTVAGTFRA
jgi:hypothetical protein